jgi:hypothetical protein
MPDFSFSWDLSVRLLKGYGPLKNDPKEVRLWRRSGIRIIAALFSTYIPVAFLQPFSLTHKYNFPIFLSNRGIIK